MRKKLAALVVVAFAAAVLGAAPDSSGSPDIANGASGTPQGCGFGLVYTRHAPLRRCPYPASAHVMRSVLTRDRASFDALFAGRDPNQRWSSDGSHQLAALTVASTNRVSLGSLGNEGNDFSCCPAMSADGRYVAFESYATNLLLTDTNNRQDIFVRDTLMSTTTRASVDSAGNQADDDSFFTAMSADGRFVVFSSFASNLVPGDTVVCGPPEFAFSCIDVFVRDLLTGTTEMVSVSSAEVPGNDFSYLAAISGDGRYVAFFSSRRTWCRATSTIPATSTATACGSRTAPTCSCAIASWERQRL